MKKFSSAAFIIIVFLVILTFSGAFYIVNETQQVIITQFGKPVGKPITEPGLNFKMPFLQKANFFDKRFQAWDGAPNQIPTKDKRFIWVDTYARWRIVNPLLFFQRLRDERRAQSRLDDIMNGETRNVVAKHVLIELVRVTNREEEASSNATSEVDVISYLEKIRYGRETLENEVMKAATPKVEALGIELLDFKIKRINYVEAVRKEVYARMISERKRIAEQFRSEGAGEAARIDGERERQLNIITSEAYHKAKEIKGKADANATDIYARSYNKDPDFYRFLKSMDTLKEAMGSNTTMILTTDDSLLKFIQGPGTRR